MADFDSLLRTLENMAEQDGKRDVMSTEAGLKMLRLVTKASKRLAEASTIANTIGLGGTEIGDLAYSVENLRHQLYLWADIEEKQ